MSRSRISGWLVLAHCLACLGACSAARPTAHSVQYDLGPLPATAATSAAVADARSDRQSSGAEAASAAPTPSAYSPAATTPRAVRLLSINVPAELDTDRLCYRLIYAEPNRARFYADSSWAARPAQLLARRLKARLGSAAHLDAVLDAADPGRAPLLKVELLEFAQYFDAPGHSRGVVSLRATLFNGDVALAQQPFVAQVDAASADAAGGAQALASASDQAIGALAAWLDARLGQ